MNNRIIVILGWIGAAFIMLSSSGGVPQAVTKAPGESGSNCSACHSGGATFNPQTEFELKDAAGIITDRYIPGQVYRLQLRVKGSNSPKTFGFQMVSLADNGNTDMGKWSLLGEKVKQITLLNRKYLVQSAPKADGRFEVSWTAPATDIGDISFYYSGLASNLNGNNSGDATVSGKTTIKPVSTSSENPVVSGIKLYPNPVVDRLSIRGIAHATLTIYNIRMENVGNCNIDEGGFADLSNLPAGMYFVQIDGPGIPPVTRMVSKI
jgi:hypothetical protein